MPLHVREAAISLSVAPGVMAPLRWKESPHSMPWAPRVMPTVHSASPSSQRKAIGRRVVRVTTMVQ